MVYSTDDFGNPNGSNAITQGHFQAQMWRTLIQGEWHGLGIIHGLPPENINRQFLNYPDLTVDLPLDEGENYFTLLGEPGPLTATDDYQRFCVNLYFDGDNARPGISVLFPRLADPEGSSVSPSRANEDQVYSLTLQNVAATPNSYYDDGLYRVSVLRASFLAPERANLSVDRMTRQGFGASGTSDWVGSLVVMVEPSESFAARAGRAVPVAGGPARRPVGGASTSPGAGAPAYIPPVTHGGPVPGGAIGPGYEDRSARARTDSSFWRQGDPQEKPQIAEDAEAEGTPTPADLLGALQQWLAAAATQTPRDGEAHDNEGAADGTPTQTPRIDPTPTPARTSTAAAERTAAPTAPVTGTPTPASTPSHSAPVTAVATPASEAGEGQRQAR